MNSKFYIIGIKHCGKSTIGRLLANELSIPYFDLDTLIEEQINMSVREYYLKNGKDAFLKAENQALQELKKSGSKSFVCATGGGICDNIEAFNNLKEAENIIYINTKFQTVYSRIIKNGIPPFLKSDNPKEEFLIMYNRRTQKYKDIATIEVNGDEQTPEQIKTEILKTLKESEIARK